MKLTIGIVAIFLFIVMISETVKVFYRWMRFGDAPEARPAIRCLAISIAFFILCSVYHGFSS